MKKFIAIALSVILVLSLCACGGGKGGEVKGTTETWGNITILVPEKMKIVGGDLFDDQNPDALTVEYENDAFKYVIVSINDEESIDMGLDSTREWNSDEEFHDLTLNLPNGIWDGFWYTSFSTKCVGLKGRLSNGYVQISAAGIDPDSKLLEAILGSIVLYGEASTGGEETGYGDDQTGVDDDVVPAGDIGADWNGWWYGAVWFDGCTGSFAGLNGYYIDAFVEFDLDQSGYGEVVCYDYGGYLTVEEDDYIVFDVTGTADENAFYSESGYSFGADVHTDRFVFKRSVSDPNMITLDDYGMNGDDKLNYHLTLMPWGTYWDAYPQYKDNIMNYDIYERCIDDNQIDPFGNHAGDVVDDGGSSGGGSTAGGSSGLPAGKLPANTTTFDIGKYGKILVKYPSDWEYNSDYDKVSNGKGTGVMFDYLLAPTNYDELKSSYTSDQYKSYDDYSYYETTLKGFKTEVVTYSDWLDTTMYVVVDFGYNIGELYGVKFAVSGNSLADCQIDEVWGIINSLEVYK